MSKGPRFVNFITKHYVQSPSKNAREEKNVVLMTLASVTTVTYYGKSTMLLKSP